MSETNRRDFCEALLAGTAIAGLAPVASMHQLAMRPDDIVVLKFPGPLSPEAIDDFKARWKKEMPGVRCMALTNGVDISVLTKGD